MKEVNIKVYSDDWRPWTVEVMKEKAIFTNGLEAEAFEKDLNERSLNENEAEQTHHRSTESLKLWKRKWMTKLRKKSRYYKC